MTARTDLMVEALDDLCEHPFLVRVLELGMVGLNFETKGDVASFQDAWYVLSVEARAEILRRQIRSLQRLVLLLEKSQSIDNIAFNIDEFLAIVSDAAHARTTSIADLCLILTREVFEIALEDIETSFGRLRKHINQPELFSVLESDSKLSV